MSSNLTAEPVERKKLDLGTALKFALRKRFGEPVNVTFSRNNQEYLAGLLDAGSEDLCSDVVRLLAYIDKHDVVNIREEY